MNARRIQDTMTGRVGSVIGYEAAVFRPFDDKPPLAFATTPYLARVQWTSGFVTWVHVEAVGYVWE